MVTFPFDRRGAIAAVWWLKGVRAKTSKYAPFEVANQKRVNIDLNPPDESLRPPHPRNDPERHLGLPEHRILSRQDYVAHHCQLAAPAQSVPVHRCYDGLPGGCGCFLISGQEAAHVCRNKALAPHLLDVGAGGKGLVARASQHDRLGGKKGAQVDKAFLKREAIAVMST